MPITKLYQNQSGTERVVRVIPIWKSGANITVILVWESNNDVTAMHCGTNFVDKPISERDVNIPVIPISKNDVDTEMIPISESYATIIMWYCNQGNADISGADIRVILMRGRLIRFFQGRYQYWLLLVKEADNQYLFAEKRKSWRQHFKNLACLLKGLWKLSEWCWKSLNVDRYQQLRMRSSAPK